MDVKHHILVIDDDPDMGLLCRQVLEGDGYRVSARVDAESGLEAFIELAPDAVLLDLRLGTATGLDVLEAMRRRDPSAAVVIMTAHGSIDSAVQAMRAGAYDYLTKPFANPLELRTLLARAIERRELMRENRDLRRALHRKNRFEELVGNSEPMARVARTIERIAPTDATVLIRGESGTGKELVARALHRHSRRAHQPFIRVSCGSLAETLLSSELFGHAQGAFTGANHRKSGLFEAADGGTIFLDEIGDTSPALQGQLLRVLQEGEVRPVGDTRVKQVDVRVLAATNRPLEAMIEQGAFRQDLFYRLKVVVVDLPALRERMDDLPLLARHLLRKHGDGKVRLADEALRALEAHDWPGNVRELEHVLERAVLLRQGATILVSDLPDELTPPPVAPVEASEAWVPPAVFWQRTIEAVTRDHIQAVLAETNGNRTRAARILGISRRTLYERLRD